MITLNLIRTNTGDQGTFGFISKFRTLELPDKNNLAFISSIPPETYYVEWSGSRYRLRDVPERSGILIHSANYGGDESKGYKSELQGCIALGLRTGTLNGQKVVIHSRTAVDRFNEMMNKKPFMLIIREMY